MRTMNLRSLIFSFVFFFVLQNANSQGGVVIKATVDKNKILIGEPIQLTIDVYLSPESVKKFINIDSIEHFEILEKPIIDTTEKAGGWNIRGVYKITSFDSGHWVIPSFKLLENIATDTIPVDVVFSSFDPARDYHDIKDIIEVKPVKKKQSWWYIAGGGLLLLILIIYLLLKKKRVHLPAPQIIINPYEEAMKQLEKLRKEKTEVKQYYSQLTDIFRLYVFRRKGILSLQKTTDDLILQLKNIKLDKEQHLRLSQALRLSDFVKFAKYQPDNNDDASALQTITESIINIEKLESESSL